MVEQGVCSASLILMQRADCIPVSTGPGRRQCCLALLSLLKANVQPSCTVKITWFPPLAARVIGNVISCAIRIGISIVTSNWRPASNVHCYTDHNPGTDGPPVLSLGPLTLSTIPDGCSVLRHIQRLCPHARVAASPTLLDTWTAFEGMAATKRRGAGQHPVDYIHPGCYSWCCGTRCRRSVTKYESLSLCPGPGQCGRGVC